MGLSRQRAVWYKPVSFSTSARCTDLYPKSNELYQVCKPRLCYTNLLNIPYDSHMIMGLPIPDYIGIIEWDSHTIKLHPAKEDVWQSTAKGPNLDWYLAKAA